MPETTIQKKNFKNPDERQVLSNMRADVVRIGDLALTRQEYQPGWRWSKDIKPVAKTESCQLHHFGILVSGRLGVRANGQEVELGPGDVVDIPPGHDGWVIGNEPAVFYAFSSEAAKRRSKVGA